VRVVFAAAGLALITLNAHAEGPDVSFSLTGATEYVWRGVTQSDENPAIFAAATVRQNGFYAGAGAENVDFLGIDTEYDLWAGWAGEVTPGITLDVGLVRYGYLDAPSGLDLDTVEVKAAVSTSFDKLAVGAAVHYTDDYFATEESATYVEVNASMPLTDKWSLSGAVARQILEDDSGSYTTWNAGVGYAVAENVTLGIRYHDTDEDFLGSAGDGRVVLSFSVAL
jgi:uncharacterized protein (TIGR02001 family)